MKVVALLVAIVVSFGTATIAVSRFIALINLALDDPGFPGCAMLSGECDPILVADGNITIGVAGLALIALVLTTVSFFQEIEQKWLF